MSEPSPPMDAARLSELAAFAQALASEVRPLSLQWFRHALEVETKLDASPVTIADRGVEAALRQRIAARYPEHGILGEEMGNDHTEAEYVWAIDPIDGTRSFITGFPLWGTLLAVLHQGVPVLGVIDVPAMDERWVGCAGSITRLNGRDCRTSRCAQIAQASLYSTSPDIFSGDDRVAFERVSRAAGMRRFGSDCYGYALLASGHVDLVMESDLQPYDYLALVSVVENAGGVITDWTGRALGMHSDGRVLAAANAELHRQALAMIAASV